MFRLKRIYTAHYRYSGSDRIDITVKGQDPDWHEFSPSWDMVMGTKKGTMSKEEYVDKYLTILNLVSANTWDRLCSYEEITLVCFCNENDFCHRNILTNYMLNTLTGRVHYMGFR